MQELGTKDWKLLYELDMNSRASFNEIAKNLGISKDAVIYRINKLKELGIIKQFHTIINTGKLNLVSFRLYLKLKNSSPKKEQEIIDYLKRQDIVTWLVSVDGEYDLNMWILTKSIAEVNILWKDLLAKYLQYIDKRHLSIFTHVTSYPRSYFLNKQNLKEFTFITEPSNIDLDNYDIQILKLMSNDARIPIITIAKHLNLASKTVISKIKHLEKTGVIVGYRTLFDLNKLGYSYFKLHFNLRTYDISAFKSYIKQHPNIIYDNEVLGGKDIEIEVQVKTLSDLRKLLDDIKTRFSEIITNYTYMVYYLEHKLVFFK